MIHFHEISQMKSKDRLKIMIRERLSDMVIDEQELLELKNFSHSVGYPEDQLEQLIFFLA